MQGNARGNNLESLGQLCPRRIQAVRPKALYYKSQNHNAPPVRRGTETVYRSKPRAGLSVARVCSALWKEISFSMQNGFTAASRAAPLFEVGRQAGRDVPAVR